MEKVLMFLRTVGNIPTEERLKMMLKIQEDEKYRQKFGKFSVIALDRFNDDIKAIYLGMAATYLAREEISYDFYQRFSHILDILPIADIHRMTEHTFLNFGDNFHSFESLGLITITSKLPTESDRKLAWRQDPNIIKVSHMRLTDWGNWAKNIILNKPIDVR